MSKQLLSINEAAAMLGVSAKTLRRWEKRDLISPQRTIGNQRRYALSDIESLKTKGSRPLLVPVKNKQSEAKERFFDIASSKTPEPTPILNADAEPKIYQINNHESLIKPKIKDHSSLLNRTSTRLGLIFFGLLGIALILGNFSRFINPAHFIALLPHINNIKSINVHPDDQVLAAATQSHNFGLKINVPVEIMSTASVSGNLTAPNILYGITAGQNIAVSGDPQNPTISTTGVSSFQGQTGAVALTAGSGISISGLTISSTGGNSFENIKVGSSTITAGSSTDTLEFVAGSNISLSADTSNKKLTINGSSTTASGWTDDGTIVRLTTSTDSVGIGTTAPASTLDVEGTFKVSGTTTFNGLTYTWPSTQSNTYILQTNGSGSLSWIDPGTLPSSNFWDQILGTITPKIESQDLLIGGQASSSAKFAVLNVNSGTPTASLSAGLAGGAYLTADGTLQTTANQRLTLGGSSTGDIFISPRSASGTLALNVGSLTVNGNTGSTTVSPTCVSVTNGIVTGTGACGTGSGGSVWTLNSTNGTLYPINSTLDTFIGGVSTASAKFGFLNVSGGTPTASISANSGNIATTLTGTGILGTTNAQTLTLGNSSTGEVILAPGGTTALTARGANLIAAGTLTGLTGLTSSGTITFSGFSSNGGPLYTNGSGVLAQVTAGTSTQVLHGGTTPSFSAVDLVNDTTGILPTSKGGSFWNSSNGALYPGNSTLDLIIGGVSSTSARFHAYGSPAFAGTTPSASISGQTSFATLVVDNTGSGDLFAASSSGVNQFVIRNGGQVGIGTTLPSGRFEIANTSTDNGLTLSRAGTSNSLTMFVNNSNFPMIQSNNTSLLLNFGNGQGIRFGGLASVGGSELNFTSFGKVGINNTNYLGTLDVNPNLTNGGTISIASISGKTSFAGLLVDNTGAGDLFTASSSGLNRFVITQNGNVGIGTTLPTANLAITQNNVNTGGFALTGAGSTSINDATLFRIINNDTTVGLQYSEVLRQTKILGGNGTLHTPAAFIQTNGTDRAALTIAGSSDSQTADLLQVYSSNSNGDYTQSTGIKFKINPSGTIATASVSGTTSFAAMVVDNAGVGDIFTASSSGLSRFTIANNGNVGIGNTLPADKLDVNGNIRIDQQANSQTALTKVTATEPGTITSGGTSLIASISASVVYNGSLYIGTGRGSVGGAEIYRYSGAGSTWTKVSQATAGTIASGGTANIASISAMTVFNGKLYVGTSKANSAEIYRYDGGTTWTVMNSTPGTLSPGGTASIDGIASFGICQGDLFAGTYEVGKAEDYRFDGNVNAWTAVNTTAGTLNGKGNDAVSAQVCWNNQLYVGSRRGAGAEFDRWNGIVSSLAFGSNPMTDNDHICDATVANLQVTSLVIFNNSIYLASDTPGGTSAQVCHFTDTLNHNAVANPSAWEVINTGATAGKFKTTTSISGVTSMTTYQGKLYIGTEKKDQAEIYQYVDGDVWSLVSTGTAGTLVTAGTANIDAVSTLIPYNNYLYAGTSESPPTTTTAAEVYRYQNINDESFALQFHAGNSWGAAGSGGGGATEQAGLLNLGSIWFVASTSALEYSGTNANSNTGSFMFSNGLQTAAGAYDVAEDYPTRDQNISPGDLVSIDPHEKGLVQRSQTPYDNKVIGVYSANPGFRLSQKGDQIDGLPSVPVALVGRVPLKVSTESGQIKSGDYLTASSVPGVAMKAVKAGQVVGRALETYDPNYNTGQILVYVNPTWYDPNIFLTDTGNVNIFDNGKIPATNQHIFGIKDANGQNITHSGVFSDFAVANLNAGGINVQNLTLGGTNLNDKLIGLEGGIASLSANFVNPIASLQTQVLSLSDRVASFEAKLTASNSAIPLSNLNSQLSTFSASSGAELNLDKLNISGSIISDKLSVISYATVNDLSVNGTFTAGLLQIKGLDNGGSSISTLNGDLKLQNQGYGGIDILNGKVTIDTKGNIIANSEITAKKFNVDTTDVSAASAGSGTIQSGTKSTIINSTAVTANSIIQITFSSDYAPATRYWIKTKTEGVSFTVNLDQPVAANAKFNWWIIN